MLYKDFIEAVIPYIQDGEYDEPTDKQIFKALSRITDSCSLLAEDFGEIAMGLEGEFSDKDPASELCYLPTFSLIVGLLEDGKQKEIEEEWPFDIEDLGELLEEAGYELLNVSADGGE